MEELLAHSAGYSGEEQAYEAHVSGVVRLAQRNLSGMAPYLGEARARAMEARLLAAARLHDLGKLDELNQAALRNPGWKCRLPIPHQNAGAEYFWAQRRDPFSAALVYGHHRPGLPDINAQLSSSAPFYIGSDEATPAELQTHTKQHLEEYLSRAGVWETLETAPTPGTVEERMLLSCLVDADWSDTSGRTASTVPGRWEERLARLNGYIRQLERNAAPQTAAQRERQRLRHLFYEQCSGRTETGIPLQYCEAPVGTGKTTAILAHLLRCAQQRKLRHIFIVLPYTSILQQVEQVLKKAVLLEGEDPEQAIAVIHHRAEYSRKELQELAECWEAPILLTTSVGLFETLASNQPARLRKLHELPGSALFLDEFHASVPTGCLPSVWQWLTELTGEWGCTAVLSSGTMVRFWEVDDFRRAYQGKRPGLHPVAVPQPLLPCTVQDKMLQTEEKRVLMQTDEAFGSCRFSTLEELIQFVLAQPGPRILMMDTRRTAALAALRLKEQGEEVYHLSNAFAPQDAARILRRVEALSKAAGENPSRQNWTLVSTVYAGMGLDLSFRSGFCRVFSCACFLQLMGRINRGGEYEEASLWAFTLKDGNTPENPQMALSREVWGNMIHFGVDGDSVRLRPPSWLATYAFREECKRDGILTSGEKGLLSYERNYKFKTMAEQFKIIPEEASVLAVTDPILVEQLKNGQHCTRASLASKSVSLYESLCAELQLQEIPGYPGLYELPEKQYDPELLGYLKELVRT